MSPRARASPACIAGCCPKLRLKRTARTRSSAACSRSSAANVPSVDPSSTKISSYGRPSASSVRVVRSYSSSSVAASFRSVTTTERSGRGRSWRSVASPGSRPRSRPSPGAYPACVGVRHAPDPDGRASYAASGCGSMPTVASDRRGPAGNPERGQSAEPDDYGADEHRRVHPVHECLSAGIAAHVGEHRRQHGDAEHAAQLADGVVGTRRLALLLAAHRGQHDVRGRREEQRHPDARHDEGCDQLEYGVVGVETSAIHASAAA